MKPNTFVIVQGGVRTPSLDLRMEHSVSLCKLLRVIAIAWIECDHFCICICIEISAAIF